VLFGVFGPSCPMSLWGLHLVRTIVETALGPHDYAAPANPAELKETLAKRQHQHLVLSFNAPQIAISEMFLRARAPIVVFAEDPLAVVAFIALEKQLPSKNALRQAVRSFVLLDLMFTNPDAYLLMRPSRATSLRYCITYVSEFYQIEADERLIDGVIARLVPEHRPKPGEDFDVQELVARFTPAANSLPAWFRALPPDEQAVLQDFRRQLSPSLEGKPLDTFTWPAQIFHDSAHMDHKMPHPIELTGAPRIIFHGPYLHLPRGRWTASFYFEATETGSPNSIRVDILANQKLELALGHSELTHDGNFRVDLKFEVAAPAASLEARLVLERGAIEGKIEFQKVEMVRDRSAGNPS